MSSYLPDAVPITEIRRALVTKLRHHGDVLLSTPVFTALKHAAPQAEIDALVYRETAPLLAGHPAIAQIHVIDREWKRAGAAAHWNGERRLLGTLKARRYDLLVHLTDHPRGLVLATLLRPRFAVAGERGAREGRLRRALWGTGFTHFYRRPRGTPRHAVEANLDALRRIGVHPDPDDRRLVLAVDAGAKARVAARLAEAGAPDRAFLHLHPGSRWHFKCWPAETNAALIGLIASRGLHVVLTGAPETHEREFVAGILARVPASLRGSITDLSGQLTLPELAALDSRARLFIGVDSAPMHIAAAMRTPVVALFGPSDEAEWGPWQVPHRIVASGAHRCRPCKIDGCGGGKLSDCLVSLDLDAVVRAVDSLLAQTADSDAPGFRAS